MTKFDNHVYMIICDVTLSLHKDTSFSSHIGYCTNMCACMKDGNLSKKQMDHICKIADVLDLVFSMNSQTTGAYISDYFLLDKFKFFQRTVLEAKEFFPNGQDKF